MPVYLFLTKSGYLHTNTWRVQLPNEPKIHLRPIYTLNFHL